MYSDMFLPILSLSDIDIIQLSIITYITDVANPCINLAIPIIAMLLLTICIIFTIDVAIAKYIKEYLYPNFLIISEVFKAPINIPIKYIVDIFPINIYDFPIFFNFKDISVFSIPDPDIKKPVLINNIM